MKELEHAREDLEKGERKNEFIGGQGERRKQWFEEEIEAVEKRRRALVSEMRLQLVEEKESLRARISELEVRKGRLKQRAVEVQHTDPPPPLV